MAEIPVAALDARQQKLVENARVALERGNFDYVAEVTTQVLKAAPGCLPVRKLQRVAQLRKNGAKSGGLMARVTNGFSNAPFMFGGPKEPAKALEAAELLLAKDPQNVAALRMLAEAARRLALPETAAFALDAIREIDPADRANLLALGEAWLAAGKAGEALKVADELLRQKSADPAAQDLMRKASVAQTVTKAGWEKQGDFREKLRHPAQAVSLEQAAKVKVAEVMGQRLLEENLARVAKEPHNVNHYRAIVQAYRSLGDFDTALVWIRKAQEHAPSDPTLEKQVVEIETAAREKKVELARSVLNVKPDDLAAVAQFEMAQVELATFRLAEAKRQVGRYPNDGASRQALGMLLLERGEADEAVAQFQQAQKAPQVRVAALVGLGRCFQRKKLYDLAATQFTAAKAESGPMNDVKKDAIYELGACYEQMGRRDEAIAEFKSIYSEDIGFRDVAEKINAFYAKS
jgi:tetratricopeptide (TPR) repeat protein